ncbi:MAG: stage II sporulation protein M [Chloroflexota bacterium]
MIGRFVDERRERWERLEWLASQARAGHRRLSSADLEELGRLYRQVTSDLAIARRDYPRDRVTDYLSQLVGRVHPVVYRQKPGDWASVGQFFTRRFPGLFRDSAPYTLLAFGLFIVPFLLAFVATEIDPLAGKVILPASPLVDQIERGQSWLDVPGSERSLMASFIMTNNLQVAFFAFAGGLLFGLGSVYVLVDNGLTIGAISGLAATHGLGGALASFVIVHGEIELTVVFTAGGAGLRIGHALLAPGLRSRGTALSQAARQAIRLLFGCVPLLVVAGLLEGFLSPSSLPPVAKIAVGGAATVALYAYLLGAGRESSSGRERARTAAPIDDASPDPAALE